jgi:hypothetical protein
MQLVGYFRNCITMHDSMNVKFTACVSRPKINEDLRDSNTEQIVTRTLNKLRVTSATCNSMPLAPIISVLNNMPYL